MTFHSYVNVSQRVSILIASPFPLSWLVKHLDSDLLGFPEPICLQHGLEVLTLAPTNLAGCLAIGEESKWLAMDTTGLRNPEITS